MKPISLMLAGVFAVLPCSCKKDSGSGETFADNRTPAATKSSRSKVAPRDSGHENRSLPPVDDKVETPKLIDSTETSFTDRQKLMTQLVATQAEEKQAIAAGDKEAIRKARENSARLSEEISEAGSSYEQTLSILKARSKRDTSDGGLAKNYVAYADQRDLVRRTRQEYTSAVVENPDVELQTQLQQQYTEESERLRELRDAWKGTSEEAK